MRLYYIDESEGPRRYVRTALGVDAERWNDLFGDIYEWRRELQEHYAIPPDRELHACDLLAGRGMLARNGGSNERLSPRQGAEVFLDGLRGIEDAAIRIDGVEVINVCIRKSDVKAYEKVSLDRLLNRINSSVKAAGRHAFLIFDEGKEKMITRAYRRLRRNRSPGSRPTASMKPSPFSTAHSTGRRRGETHRESSGGEGQDKEDPQGVAA